MTKSSLLIVAITLAILGGAVMVGHPPWGAVTGISILLAACAMATGAIATGSSPETFTELKVSRQRVPNTLVALSATAIVAVYAAGYYRTQRAADQFEAQAIRHNAAVVAVAESAQPRLVLPTLEVPPPAQRSTAPAPTNETARPSSTTSQVPLLPAATAPPPATSVATLPLASTASEPVAQPAAPVLAKAQISYKDGTFLGWGRCRHGNIQVSVAIEGGRIIATEITQCLTRYSCSWISDLPGQVMGRQSSDVDYVSGATESTDAFYDAVTSALAAAHE